MDITLRLEPIILDIERTREPILIVGKPITFISHCILFHPTFCHLMLFLCNHRHNFSQATRAFIDYSMPISWVCRVKRLRM